MAGITIPTEKRYVNGKEITIKPKQPVNIQKTINKKNLYTGDLNDLTSSYDPEELYKQYAYEMGEAFGRDSFLATSPYNETDKDRTRQRMYAIYREMWNQIFIQNALLVIKNEASQANEDKNRIKVISDNQDIVDDAYELFYDILDLNYEIKNIICETTQMGDCFLEAVLDNYEKPKSIIHTEWLDPSRVRKIIENGRLKFYVYILEDIDAAKQNGWYVWDSEEEKKNLQKQVKFLMPWQIIHFRIKDQSTEPYGRSLFKAGVKDYRRLALLEDSMLVYRISRAPERRVFYVDVGQMNTREVMIYLNKIKNIFKKEPIIDENGGISEKANVMSPLEDYYVPKREGQSGTQIQTLAPGMALNEIKDVDYFKDKLLRLLNIPLTYIGGSSAQGMSDQSRTLSAQDIKFSNFIEDIQDHIIKGLNKLLSLQLIIRGYKNDEIRNFKIELTPPSHLNEMLQNQVLNDKMATAAAYKGSQLFSDEWIYKNIFRMSIKEMYGEQVKLAAQMQKMAAMAQQGGAMPGGEMGGAPMGGAPIGGEAGGAPMGGEVGGAPAGGELPTVPVAPAPQAQMASNNTLNNLLHKMGVNYLMENSDEILVENIVKILGDSYLVENSQDVTSLLTEVRKIKTMLEKDEENTKTKKRQKNDFKSMVLHGEFEGIDINGNYEEGKEIKFYKDGNFEDIVKSKVGKIDD